MVKNVGVLIIVSSVICNGIAFAEPVAVAYASYANSKQDTYQDPSLDSTDVVLRQHMYTIQQETSNIQLHVKSPIGDVWVTFDDFDGDFSLLGASGNSNVASIEVNATKMDTRRGMVRMLLKSGGFLDVDNFPTMRFTGKSFEWYSDTQAILKGDMTIKDTTRQVAFYVELVDDSIKNIDSERVTVKAMATIKRSDFGITTLLPVVSDNVNLFININAQTKGTPLSLN